MSVHKGERRRKIQALRPDRGSMIMVSALP